MSSCLNLKRLIPHKKVWKLLTNKLHFKLITSKKSKKPKHRSFKTPKKISWPPLSIQPKKFKKQPKFNTIIYHKNHHCYLQRRPPPVFVDQLYVEPISTVEEHVVSSPDASAKSKESENLDRKSSGNEGNNQMEPCNEGSVMDGDEVWESMGMDSAQMHEIDERADEFIARFRAEMKEQEILTRGL